MLKLCHLVAIDIDCIFFYVELYGAPARGDVISSALVFHVVDYKILHRYFIRNR